MGKNKDENKRYILYAHINKINNKMYVGITSKTLKERFRSNGNGYMSCGHFWHAIQKYGWENFDHIVLMENLSEEDACYYEKLFIKAFCLTDQDIGYNISEGGDKGCLLSGENHPMYGKRLSPESIEKMRQTKRERNKTRVTIMSESAKEKIRKALIGNQNVFCRKVMCIETGIIYSSAAEAARATGADSSAILKCVKGTMHKTKNLHWKEAV